MAPIEELLLLPAAAFIGSFLGLVIERLPAGLPVVLGRSRCRACGHALPARDLVPVVSWLALRGRCRHCRAAIGWFAPAIELAAVMVVLWSVAVLPGWLALAGAGLGLRGRLCSASRRRRNAGLCSGGRTRKQD